MTGDLYEDVKIVHEAICGLHSMVGILEKECMMCDKGKVATELFIHINDMKREMEKVVSVKHVYKALFGILKNDIMEAPEKIYIHPDIGGR